MPFPKTRTDLQRAGYVFQGHANCKGCEVVIEFWTTPAGRNMPMNRMINDDSPAIPHWGSCPKADKFRRAA